MLLPRGEAKKVADQCSRPGPPEFNETWQPTGADIRLLESRLSRLKGLRAEGCCMKGARVEDPEHFHMQYVGIVVKGRRLIYINAFAEDDPPDSWKTQAYIVCDGGVDWGVLYDPATGKFSDLAVNGGA